MGASNCFTKVCASDAALSRPLALLKATTTMLTVSVSDKLNVTLDPDTLVE